MVCYGNNCIGAIRERLEKSILDLETEIKEDLNSRLKIVYEGILF